VMARAPALKGRSFYLRGLDEVIEEMRLTPRQFDRATQNAINGMLTRTQQEIVKTVNQETGLKPKVARSRLISQRASPQRLEGVIYGTPGLILLEDYKVKKTKISPTRVAITYRDEVGRPYRTPKHAYINPKYRADRIYRRKWLKSKGRPVGRLPFQRAIAPSMARHLEVIVTPAFERRQADAYQALLLEKLQFQARPRKK